MSAETRVPFDYNSSMKTGIRSRLLRPTELIRMTALLLAASTILASNAPAQNATEACRGIKPIAHGDIDEIVKTPGLAIFNFRSFQFDHFEQFRRIGGQGDLILNSHPQLTPENSSDAVLLNNVLLRVREFPKSGDSRLTTAWLRDNQSLERLRQINSRVPIFLIGNTDAAKAFIAPRDHQLLADLIGCGVVSEPAPVALFLSGDATEDSVFHETVHIEDRLNGALDEFRRELMRMSTVGLLSTQDREAIYGYVSEQRAYTRQLEYLRDRARTGAEAKVQLDGGELTRKELYQQLSRAIPAHFAKRFPDAANAALKHLKEKSASEHEGIRQLVNALVIKGPLARLDE